ncbi:hypothetical protein PHLCEN_2v9077 [Hermanssonia centrifuga]|uniref:BRO1 domain-containing protein n=1 Tax=Hermanssonia centrifuga TaxID=98765 RepID=A0A2R6NRZ6_9APHY|nr:hypothetical protein PHLCEN_2v9077 [Hermanssonia centrifuga]
MPNQLSIPFKDTYPIPIRRAVREYILAHHTDTHPDAFKWDINRWEILRKDGTGGAVHVDRVKTVLSYHAQLVFILSKLPIDIGLDIPYTAAFDSSALPLALRNLAYERAAVLFNLAALYSQLAAAEDRTTSHGLKQAITYHQSAAGTIHHLYSSGLAKLQASLPDHDMPIEFTESVINSLESLMLAQAQEAVWQRAMLDNYKNGVIAKLAAKVASFYHASCSRIQGAPSNIKQGLPFGWLPHLETKQLHFEAAALLRKSMDDLDANRYGHEIARLMQAHTLAKRGSDVGRRGGVAQVVQNDIKSLVDTIQKNLIRAERDNDLIYHQEVPSISSLPPVIEASMVQPLIPGALAEPKTALGDDAVIFGELLGYGAKLAIDIYRDRRRDWIQEEVVDRAQRLDDLVASILRSLNLPAALEALEKPIGLPPSLLKKAEEVRQDHGPAKVESSIDNVQKLSQRNANIIDEAMDVLDQEAEADEEFQEESSNTRSPSQEANKDFVAKAERYRGILQRAAESDEVVRSKWEEWEQNITELTWSEADLEASVPSSAVSLSKPSSRGPNSTQSHARQLRVLLESLNDIQRSRDQSVTRAKRLADAEDITPRILKAAAAVERWVEVQPSMFEDVLDEELSKYDKFREDIEEGEQNQEVLLESIKERNEMFLQSRKEDPSVKEREHALQSLDLAFHKYKEITRNLDEGLKFYNDFGTILTQFLASCKDWANRRKNEMHEMRSLSRSLHSISLEQSQPKSIPTVPSRPLVTEPVSPPLPAKAVELLRQSSLLPQHLSRAALDLPPPDSDEWESMPLPGPAPPSARKPVPAKRVR